MIVAKMRAVPETLRERRTISLIAGSPLIIR